jgi:S1-C subfamily serine protease
VIGFLGLMAIAGATAIIALVSTDDADTGDQIPPPVAGDKSIAEPPGTDIYSPPADMASAITSVTASTVLLECSNGIGSGFALDTGLLGGGRSEVVIITNDHVLEGCGDVITASNDAGSSPVQVLGTDPRLDLAVVRAPQLQLEPLEPTTVQGAGQWVMAVGSPLGVQNSVSFGNLTAYEANESLITHSAVIGPGNSGGPLVDNTGQVLGVNSAVWEEATGISLAVPVTALCQRLLDCT